MKTVIIVPVFMTGGGECMAAQLAVHLDRSRMDVEVISMYPRQGHVYEKKVEDAGIPVHYMNKGSGKSITAQVRLWRELSRLKPDVIHGHLYASFYALPWVLTHRAKLVHTIHTKPDEEFSGFLRGILQFFARLGKVQFVVISKINQQIACRAFHCGPQRYPVVNNPVEIERFCRREKNDGRITFINVSRLNRDKNLGLIIRAMPGVLAQVPNARLVLVGDGELREALRQEAVRLGVQEQVEFAGEQARPEDFLARADVYVLSSHLEGLPLSVLEAMAAGLPVISTNVGGMADIVKDNGVLIAEGDQEALTREMIRFAQDPALRERCAEASRELVKAYDAKACAEAYTMIYKKITG